jgi:poly(glycerol-phosphate) alpha-glucosyltransferase
MSTLRVGLLTASLSRRAGNLFPPLAVLGRSLHHPPEIDVLAFGLRDEMTEPDLSAWGALTVVAAGGRGPRRMGFSRDLDIALAGADLDLLHVHGLWTYTSVASRRWADATARPYLVTPHGMLDPWAVRRHRWKKLGAALLFELAHLRGAVCLHARCEVEARALRALRLRNPICVVPNAVELPPEPPPSEPRIPFFDGAGEHLLLCLGPLARDGNVRILLQAWRRARQRSPAAAAAWSLVIVGAEEERGALLRDCAALAIEKTVHVIGSADGCVSRTLWAAAAAVVLLPAASEQTANAMRAWSHGRPVLLCGAAAAPADLRAAAALAVPATADDLAQGLLTLLETNAAERAAMGASARRLIESRVAPAAIAEEMARVYRWMLGGAPRPSCVVVH